MTVSPDFIKQLQGHSLVTAHILYRLPDYQSILQTFLWQEYDLSPKFPRLMGFLEFWKTSIEGPLHSVRVGHVMIIKPPEIEQVKSMIHLH